MFKFTLLVLRKTIFPMKNYRGMQSYDYKPLLVNVWSYQRYVFTNFRLFISKTYKYYVILLIRSLVQL